MRSLRSEFIGSMRAWLPSRRSTAHHRGAVSMRFVGHVRSGSSNGICSWKGWYFRNGIPDVSWGWIISALSSSAFRSVSGRTRETPRRGGPGSGLVAAEKEEAHRSHDFTVCRVLRPRPPLGPRARIVRRHSHQGNGGSCRRSWAVLPRVPGGSTAPYLTSSRFDPTAPPTHLDPRREGGAPRCPLG